MEKATSSPSLANKRIVITRACRQAAALADLIHQFGGLPIAYPCIKIKLPANDETLDRHLRQLNGYDWIAFTSSNAVWALAERIGATGSYRELADVKVAALGPTTAAECRRLFARAADFIPSAYSSERLARELPIAPGARVFLPQSDLADDKAADILRERGALVTARVAYQTRIATGGVDLPAFIAQGRIDALSFASPSAVRFFRQRCPLEEALCLPAACLGASTAKSAAELGFATVIAPEVFSLRAMIQALSDFFAAQSIEQNSLN